MHWSGLHLQLLRKLALSNRFIRSLKIYFFAMNTDKIEGERSETVLNENAEQSVTLTEAETLMLIRT